MILTADGSNTIYNPSINDHYHSVNGAIQESVHIFIERGFSYSSCDNVKIFEVGFGTGLNAFLTVIESNKGNRSVSYTSIEKFPLGNDVTSELNYHTFFGETEKEIWEKIHNCSWNQQVQITDKFILHKIMSDFTEFKLNDKYNLIYFDAFGPDKQPEMWSAECFGKIADATEKGGILVTYSAKGEVKRILKACGFEIELLAGPPGKRQMIRAVKN